MKIPQSRPYEEFLGKPNGPKAHELLHTSYTKRRIIPLGEDDGAVDSPSLRRSPLPVTERTTNGAGNI